MARAKVTINEPAAPDSEPAAGAAAGAGASPAVQLALDAKKEVRLPPDSRGRVIELSKPGVLAQFRLVKILGKTAENQTYMNMILPLIYIKSIDGEAVSAPQNEREVDALIQRLDEEGVANVSLGVMRHYNGVVMDMTTGQPRLMSAEEALEAQKEVIKK